MEEKITAWSLIDKRIKEEGINPGNPFLMTVLAQALLSVDSKDTRDYVFKMSALIRIVDLFVENFYENPRNRLTVIKGEHDAS